MAYSKTTFVEGAAPGLSAAELNKMGQGIADASAVAEAAIPAAQKGAPTGVATLDGQGKLVQDAKTLAGLTPSTAGGAEGNRLAQTDASGGVGRANALKDGGGTYRAASSPGAATANSVAVTDANGRVGDSVKVGGRTPGTANGVATLDASSKVPESQLPPMNYVDKGTNSGAVAAVLAYVLDISTRSEVIIFDANDRISRIEYKDGATVVVSKQYTYTVDGSISKEVITGGGKSITITYNYDPFGNLTGQTRSVV